MKKLHLTRYAAMATLALMGTTAAWADVDASGTGWSLSGGTLTLNSNSESDKIVISFDEASTINGFGTPNKIVVDRGSLGTTLFSTIMLPAPVFVHEDELIEAVYTVGSMDYYDNVPELTMQSVTELYANKPYIIKFRDGKFGASKNITFNSVMGNVEPTDESSYATEVSGSCFSMTGTYETKQWNNGSSLSNDYGFSADGTDQGKFVRIQNNPNSSESVTLLPARAYLTCTKAQLVNGLGKVAEESLPDVINVRFVDKDGGTLSIGKMNTKTGDIQMQDRYYDLKGRKLNGKPQNKVMYVNKKVIKH